MSLSLIQGYSSAEEDDHPHLHHSSSDDDDAAHHDAVVAEPSAASHPSLGDRSIFDRPQPSSACGLPSAFDAFSEVAGPPQFLNNSVKDYNPAKDAEPQQGRHGSRRNRRDKKDLPTGAVVEAKPQLVGIHERVRTDNGSQQPASAPSSTPEGGKRMSTATNPNAEFWARSLRCGWSRPDLHLFSNLMIPLHMPWKEELPFCPHPHNTHFAVSVWTRDWRR